MINLALDFHPVRVQLYWWRQEKASGQNCSRAPVHSHLTRGNVRTFEAVHDVNKKPHMKLTRCRYEARHVKEMIVDHPIPSSSSHCGESDIRCSQSLSRYFACRRRCCCSSCSCRRLSLFLPQQSGRPPARRPGSSDGGSSRPRRRRSAVYTPRL